MRVRSTAQSSLLLFAALLAVPGCSAPEPPPGGEGDHYIQREIKLQFEEDLELKDVWPECVDGVVTLRGHVPTIEARRRAVRIAARITTGYVIPRIEVRGR